MAAPMSTMRRISAVRRVIWSSAEPEQPPLEPQQFTPGLEVIEGCVLKGNANAEPDSSGLVDDVVAGNPGTPATRTQERAQHADDRRLTGPVGPQEPIDLTRPDGEVEAVNGDVRPEGPDQALCFYGPPWSDGFSR